MGDDDHSLSIFFLTPLICWQSHFGDAGYPESVISPWLVRTTWAWLTKDSSTPHFSLVGHFGKTITATKTRVNIGTDIFQSWDTSTPVLLKTLYWLSGEYHVMNKWKGLRDLSLSLTSDCWVIDLLSFWPHDGSSVQWLGIVGVSEIMTGFVVSFLNSQWKPHVMVYSHRHNWTPHLRKLTKIGSNLDSCSRDLEPQVHGRRWVIVLHHTMAVDIMRWGRMSLSLGSLFILAKPWMPSKDPPHNFN